MSNKRYSRIPLSRVGLDTLELGYQGENMHTQVVINCAEIYADYPDAEAEMIIAPPSGDQYPAIISVDDGILTWDILASDTASSGTGRYQLIFADDGTEIMRSAIGSTRILPSLDGTTGGAPTPAETWAEAMASEFEEQIAEAAETVTPVIVVDCGSISTLPVTLTAEGVTADYKAIAVELGTPTVMTSALTVTTGDGTVTLAGTKGSASTTCTVTLIKATNTVTGEVAE